MTTPIYLDKQEPAVYDAMVAAARQVKDAALAVGFDRKLVELVNLRVSQINGCAFCLDLHARLALKAGEEPRRLAVLPAWRDTELFEPKERAALELAEVITQLPPVPERAAAHARVRSVLSTQEFSVVSWIAVTMNAFNRVSITSGHPVTP